MTKANQIEIFAETLEQLIGQVYFPTRGFAHRNQRKGALGASSKTSVSIAATVCCGFCGVAGQAHGRWTENHKHHVRCTCGTVVTRKGLAAHLTRRRNREEDDPCPNDPLK